MEALERASSVPERLGGAGGGAIEAQGPAECEKAGNPRAVWKARQAGKGGRGGGGRAAWAATSKGPRGVPGQLAPLALLRAPD